MAVVSDAVVPFRLDVPEAETVDDWSQGPPLAYVRDLCRHWAERYDWRAAEARPNGFPQFRTVLDAIMGHAHYTNTPRETRIAKAAAAGAEGEAARLAAELAAVRPRVRSEKLGEVATEFDAAHSVERAHRMGSVHTIVPAAGLRPYLVDAVRRGMARFTG